MEISALGKQSAGGADGVCAALEPLPEEVISAA